MTKSMRSAWAAALCSLWIAGFGCGGGDDGGGGSAGSDQSAAGSGQPAAGSGTPAGSGATPSAECVNTDEPPNLACPEKIPLDGTCAAKGECCHRASNIAREALLGPDEPLVLEYRINYALTKNHPITIGSDLIVTAGTLRSDNEEQSLLWRFEMPRQAGELIPGPGQVTIGVGRYNCDGTYSYYNEQAAPVRQGVNDDRTRWAAETVESTVDPAKSGKDRNYVPFLRNSNRDRTYTPFVNATSFELEWELVNQGFDILEIDTEESGRDCIGSRNAAAMAWEAGGTFVIYTPIMDANDSELITAAGGITYCQLVAFGPFAVPTCKDTPRCMPGDGCEWKKIPDALCPTSDQEKSQWGCHLGALGNVNLDADYPTDAELNCTMEPPSGVLDPDADPNVSKGQCCDPLGAGTDGLPACNAFRLIQDYVAAAAEITEETVGELQPKCM